jgi:hypothetical protein
MTKPPFELAHLMMLSLLSCVLGRNHHAGDTGFDFLGYRFGAPVLKLAQATIEKFVEQATQLYEQGRRERSKALLLGKYVRRWLGWATGGLANLPGGDFDPKRSTIANDWIMPLMVPHTRAASLV